MQFKAVIAPMLIAAVGILLSIIGIFSVRTKEDAKIKDVQFYGGCNGNLQGICSLIKGMPIGDVIGKLQGIRCGSKPTSCPDQLSRALSLIVEKEGNGEK